MRHPLYLIYGVLLLAWMATAAYHGSPFIGASSQRSEERSQDGARQSRRVPLHLRRVSHYSGGK